MADRASLSQMRVEAWIRGQRANFDAAVLLGANPETYEPTSISTNMQGDRELIHALRIDGYIASANELIKQLAERVVALEKEIEALKMPAKRGGR